jgi:hypothetical protein
MKGLGANMKHVPVEANTLVYHPHDDHSSLCARMSPMLVGQPFPYTLHTNKVWAPMELHEEDWEEGSEEPPPQKML